MAGRRAAACWIVWAALLVGAGCKRAAAEPPIVIWEPERALAPGLSARQGRLPPKASWRLVDLAIDPARIELRVVLRSGGGMLGELVPAGALVATNGGYFMADYRPTGWLVDRGRELAPRASRTSGGVLAVRREKTFIGQLRELPFAPEVAVQNSPRLVERGGRVGIRTDDGKRAARTVACEASALHLVCVLAPAFDGPTLLETARLLVADPARGGLGCRAALNLDGGPSTGLWAAPATGLPSSPPLVRIGYALALVPR